MACIKKVKVFIKAQGDVDARVHTFAATALGSAYDRPSLRPVPY